MSHHWNEFRSRAALFWTGVLFRLALVAPGLARLLKPLALQVTWMCAGRLRRTLYCNAKRLLADGSTSDQRRRLAQGVLSSFFDTVLEFGNHQAVGVDELRSRLAGVEGEEAYIQARAAGRGAVLVTAHLGRFETAIGLLRHREPNIHVVFRRDASPVFERLRSDQRRRLGVLEAPTDDGLLTWIRMRDALRSDHVVLIQGDRTMPGEKGVALPFLGGHMLFPLGPIKLARAADAPVIPVFACQDGERRIHIAMGEPVWPARVEHRPGQPDAALMHVARTIERYVSRYPEQWLVLQYAWCEDQHGEECPK